MEDFNFPEIDWSTNSTQKDENHPASRFLSSTMEGLMTQHIMEPTRWRDGQEANPLDLIFTNKDGLISDIEVPAPVGKSDHGVILFKMTK